MSEAPEPLDSRSPNAAQAVEPSFEGEPDPSQKPALLVNRGILRLLRNSRPRNKIEQLANDARKALQAAVGNDDLGELTETVHFRAEVETEAASENTLKLLALAYNGQLATLNNPVQERAQWCITWEHLLDPVPIREQLSRLSSQYGLVVSYAREVGQERDELRARVAELEGHLAEHGLVLARMQDLVASLATAEGLRSLTEALEGKATETRLDEVRRDIHGLVAPLATAEDLQSIAVALQGKANDARLDEVRLDIHGQIAGLGSSVRFALFAVGAFAALITACSTATAVFLLWTP